jgi:F0F1-type ATP synthase assembly protein I
MAALKTTDDESARTRAAKRAFYVSLFDLSWRLLGAMLGPLFIGLYIDSKRDGGQTFALIGFVLGMICGVLVIRSVVNKIAKGGSD